jgi:monovalent cation:proton antiporter-2 (CPA2) family protein
MLVDALLLLVAAVIAVPLFQRLGLGSVLGYLAAGLVVGPSVLGLIGHVDDVRRFADLGIVLLLFVIGLELKPSRLWTMRRTVFGLGMAQVVATGGALSALAYAVALEGPAAVVVGFGLALSSTAFVLQLLAQRNELGSQEGRSAFGVLLLQDLAVAPLLVMVGLLAPDYGGGRGMSVGVGLLEGLGALVLVILAGRFAVRPLLRHIAAANNSEVFAATALLLALGTGWLMEHAGLSMALGAFLAGVLLSNSEFRHQITADIEHFRGLLLGLFFMAVGMTVDLGLLATQWSSVLVVLAVLIAVKAMVLYPVTRLFGLNRPQGLRTTLYLAQAGEFAFVLFNEASRADLLGEGHRDLLVLVVAISMLITPVLFAAARWLGERFHTYALPRDARDTPPDAAAGAVLVAGFGRFGYRIGSVLMDSGIPFVAVDSSPLRVLRAREQGLPVYYGDATRPDVLRHLGAEHARLAVVTLDQPLAAERTVQALRRQCPEVPIFARSRSGEDSLVLQSLGVEATVPEALESSLQLAASVLRRLGLEEPHIGDAIDRFREADYRRLREAGPHPQAGLQEDSG